MSSSKMEQRAVIKFCVKLNKTASETIEMLESACIEDVCVQQLCVNGIKGPKNGHYKMINSKAVL
jgi:hypothetical protein